MCMVVSITEYEVHVAKTFAYYVKIIRFMSQSFKLVFSSQNKERYTCKVGGNMGLLFYFERC